MEQLTLLWETLLSGFLNSGINTSRIIVSLGLSFVLGIYIFLRISRRREKRFLFPHL